MNVFRFTNVKSFHCLKNFFFFCFSFKTFAFRFFLFLFTLHFYMFVVIYDAVANQMCWSELNTGVFGVHIWACVIKNYYVCGQKDERVTSAWAIVILLYISYFLFFFAASLVHLLYDIFFRFHFSILSVLYFVFVLGGDFFFFFNFLCLFATCSKAKSRLLFINKHLN